MLWLLEVWISKTKNCCRRSGTVPEVAHASVGRGALRLAKARKWARIGHARQLPRRQSLHVHPSTGRSQAADFTSPRLASYYRRDSPRPLHYITHVPAQLAFAATLFRLRVASPLLRSRPRTARTHWRWSPDNPRVGRVAFSQTSRFFSPAGDDIDNHDVAREEEEEQQQQTFDDFAGEELDQEDLFEDALRDEPNEEPQMYTRQRSNQGRVNTEEWDNARRIHICGIGGLGKLVAHSLRSLPDPPPVSLVFHKEDYARQFGRDHRKLSLTTNGVTVTNDDYQFEVLQQPRDSHTPMTDDRGSREDAINRDYVDSERSGKSAEGRQTAEADALSRPGLAHINESGSEAAFRAGPSDGLAKLQKASQSSKRPRPGAGPADGLSKLEQASQSSKRPTRAGLSNGLSKLEQAGEPSKRLTGAGRSVRGDATSRYEAVSYPERGDSAAVLPPGYKPGEPRLFLFLPGMKINYLILTVKSVQVIPTLYRLRFRIGPESAILFLCRGLGIIEEVNEKVFPNPATRPRYLFGLATHGVHTNSLWHATHERPGSIAIAMLAPQRLNTAAAAKKSRLGSKSSYPSPALASSAAPSADSADRPQDSAAPSPDPAGTPHLDLSGKFHRHPSQIYLLRSVLRCPALAAYSVTPVELIRNLWSSLAFDCVVAPLTVMLDCRVGPLLFTYRATRTMRLLISEFSHVARNIPELRGYPETEHLFSPDRIESDLVAHLKAKPDLITPLLAEVRLGRKPDSYYTSQYIVRRGEQLGFGCVVNYMMLQMVLAKQHMIQRELASNLPVLDPVKARKVREEEEGLLPDRGEQEFADDRYDGSGAGQRL